MPKSLAQQKDGPSFEMVVVDDGSRDPAPEFVANWSRVFPITVVRQEHAGISVARNKGIQTSIGTVLVFIDADCRMQAGCLTALEQKITERASGKLFSTALDR